MVNVSCGHGAEVAGGMKAVVETIELPMAGQESEPAIFLGEANVGLGRSTACCCWHEAGFRPKPTVGSTMINGCFIQNSGQAYIRSWFTHLAGVLAAVAGNTADRLQA